MTDPDLNELRQPLASGDESAFADLFDRCGDRLLAVALGLVRRRDEAEDAVQETFAALVRSRHRLVRVRDLEAYLFTVLRRQALRVLDGRRREPAPLPEEVMHCGEREAEDQRADLLRDLRQALPSKQREVLALKIEGGLTFAEIGRVLGVSADTAASRYRYALAKLKTGFERRSVETKE